MTRANTTAATRTVWSQPTLVDALPSPQFPTTRYQGSKAKLAPWIWQHIKDLPFDTVLDAFGGTGCIAHLLKRKGKAVTYNDVLHFNYVIGRALLENEGVRLTDEDTDSILTRHAQVDYPDFIQRTFRSIYFTDDENAWLDMVVSNIRRLSEPYAQSLGYFALFEACLAKRPFNLFHRRNLYIRTADVRRTFGNKATWDTPFATHFRAFVGAGNRAVFANGRRNLALNCDAIEVPGDYDLVYIDTPYIAANGIGVDYLAFYHFLEGLSDYDRWPERVDYASRHLAFRRQACDWCSASRVQTAFGRLFERFRNSILVVSYRADGVPSIEELVALLRRYKRRVDVAHTASYRYVLSKRRSAEVILIAQ